MHVQAITQNNYCSSVLHTGTTALLYFWAAWCCPSEVLHPVFEQLAKEQPHVLVGKVNYMAEKKLVESMGITAVPTVLVVKNGVITARSTQVFTMEDALRLLTE